MKNAEHISGVAENLNPPSFTTLLTFVLWLGCVAVGAVGLAIPYSRPHPAPHPSPAVQAEILNVQLERDDTRTLNPEPSRQPDPVTVPPLMEPTTLPAAPPLIAVAEATLPVAFALPIEGPVQVVPVREAAYVRPEPQPAAPENLASATSNVPQRLTYGEGEGRQPAPEYPRRAITAGEEGTVIVRFAVGDNGRVLLAETSTPSTWPLLNEAAVRVVRERWRFRTGNPRLYEVAIRFQLQK